MDHCLVDGGDVTESPGGRAPLSIVLDGVPAPKQPPVVTSGWLYGTPMAAEGRESVTICSGVPLCACSNEAAVQMPAAARIPRVHLAVITHHRPIAHGARAVPGVSRPLRTSPTLSAPIRRRRISGTAPSRTP